jgi:origin recognition complex subunit 4
MCLIGITCRIDVLDLLEKRIKSRFSHRQIYLFNEYNFDKFIEMAKFFIINNNSMNGFNDNNEMKVKLHKHLTEYVDSLFNENDMLKQFTRLYEIDKSMASLKRLLLLPSVQLKELDKETLKSKNLIPMKNELNKAFKMFNIDTKYSLLGGVSILELTLIVVMLEMSELYVDEPFNFDLIYNSYLKYLQRKNWFQQKQERQVILKV